MAFLKTGFATLFVAVIAPGCASNEASNAVTASKAESKVDTLEYLTGSRLPRRGQDNTQGTKVITNPEDFYRNVPPAGLKGD